MPVPAWSPHPQLENDTVPVGDLVLCRVLAIDDADYPWLVLVPRRAGAVEIADLGADAARLMDEILLASPVLKTVTACAKLNIAAIGNLVPQLHVHIVAKEGRSAMAETGLGFSATAARRYGGVRTLHRRDPKRPRACGCRLMSASAQNVRRLCLL